MVLFAVTWQRYEMKAEWTRQRAVSTATKIVAHARGESLPLRASPRRGLARPLLRGTPNAPDGKTGAEGRCRVAPAEPQGKRFAAVAVTGSRAAREARGRSGSNRASLYQEITDRITAELEAGRLSWEFSAVAARSQCRRTPLHLRCCPTTSGTDPAFHLAPESHRAHFQRW